MLDPARNYAVALIPSNKNIFNGLVDLSQKLFSVFDCYQLNKDNSFPHISLLQFQEKKSISDQPRSIIQKLDLKELPVDINPKLHKKITDDGVWFELLPSKTCLPMLTEIHCVLVQEFEAINIRAMNPSGNFFQPHITLARSMSVEENRIDGYLFDQIIGCSAWRIVLGCADQYWQLSEEIKC